jgi:hypothetical protein
MQAYPWDKSLAKQTGFYDITTRHSLDIGKVEYVEVFSTFFSVWR